MPPFSARLIQWQLQLGRHDLPWQRADAYRVWLSEVMLQQTQVATVIPYYQRFVASFPDVKTLAAASSEQVLAHWSGLGYYARGRNLHRTAQIIVEQYQGKFPQIFEQIVELPGIGRSTAAAICALAYHQQYAILDGNVKRVLARWCGVTGWPGEKKIEAQLWQQAEQLLPLPPGEGWGGGAQDENTSSIATYTQALMDLGATICTRGKPQCTACPVQTDCVAFNELRVTELPTPRSRKSVPEKHATFLLLQHGNHILLEQRPPHGIWGGLLCPPQIDDGNGVVEDYLQRSGLQVADRTDLQEFSHTFTHFKLHISPVLMRVRAKAHQVQQAGNIWLDIDEALRAAIPAPVRKMLQGIVG